MSFNFSHVLTTTAPAEPTPPPNPPPQPAFGGTEPQNEHGIPPRPEPIPFPQGMSHPGEFPGINPRATGPSSGVVSRRVFILTIILLCEVAAFALLLSMNRGVLNVYQRSPQTNIPSLLLATTVIDAVVAAFAFILIGIYLFNSDPTSFSSGKEFILAGISFCFALLILIFNSILATRQYPSVTRFYCGTGAWRNEYCAVAFHTFNGLSWTATAASIIFTLDAILLGYGLQSVRQRHWQPQPQPDGINSNPYQIPGPRENIFPTY